MLDIIPRFISSVVNKVQTMVSVGRHIVTSTQCGRNHISTGLARISLFFLVKT